MPLWTGPRLAYSTVQKTGAAAHGKGRLPVKPKARHAELAVNLAGTMAMFLISTWVERKGSLVREVHPFDQSTAQPRG
jgi:Abortive infection C-terminus